MPLPLTKLKLINIQKGISKIRISQKFKIVFLGSSLTAFGILIGSMLLTRNYPTYNPGYNVANFSVGNFQPYRFVIDLKPVSPICCDQTPDIWVDIEFQPLSNKENQQMFFYVYWPGQVEKYYSRTDFKIESQKDIVAGEEIYGSILRGEFKHESNESSNTETSYRISFIWRNGIEGYGFSERLLRFGLSQNTIGDRFVVKVYQNINISTLEESPSPDTIEVDPNFGQHVKIYTPTWDSYNNYRISMLYIDENYRVIGQFLLLLSGVIIGIGTNLISQALIEKYAGSKQCK